jgi:hypothetical protein
MHNIKHPQVGATKPIIFYLDETWVTQNHCPSKTWHDSNNKGGLKVPIVKGGRATACHVGPSETGFLKRCKLIFWTQK